MGNELGAELAEADNTRCPFLMKTGGGFSFHRYFTVHRDGLSVRLDPLKPAENIYISFF